MQSTKGISLVRYVLSLYCTKINSSLLLIYLIYKYVLEMSRREKYGEKMLNLFPIRSIPKDLLKSIVSNHLPDLKNINEHQIIVPTIFFESLYQENLFFRDGMSLWVTAKILKPEDTVSKDLAVLKNCLQKEFHMNTKTNKMKDMKYAKSSNFVEVERIVQIVPSDKLTDKTVLMSNIELFNVNMALGNKYPKKKDVFIKFLPIQHVSLAPSFAKKAIIEMIRIPMHVGTDLTDTLLKIYFETPRFLHTGDCFKVELTEKYTRNLHFKYLNVVKHIKRLYFRCKIAESEDACSKGYFVVQGETELIQEANINSFLPQIDTCCVKSHQKLMDSVETVDELFYNNCPFGFDKYLEEIKVAIEPFLLDKKNNPLHNELKCNLQAVFLLRSNFKDMCRQLMTILAKQTGLNFIPVSCYQLISSTAKQTETKLDALIQKAKDVSPVLVYLENFDIFAVNTENEEDVRITGSFVHKLKVLFDNYDNHPIIFIANCSIDSELKQNLSRVFLEEFCIRKLSIEDRLELFKWLIIDKNILFCDFNYKILNNTSKCLQKIQIKSNSHVDIDDKTICDEKACEKENSPLNVPDFEDCELCKRKKYYDDILERIVSKTEGLEYGDIDSLMYIVLRDSYLNQMKNKESYNDQKADFQLVREEDFNNGIETLRSLQNKKISPLKIPNVNWSDIGGLEDLKKEIIRTIELPLKFPHLFIKSGLKRSGILLWGPPGCGKTLVARAIASQLKANFLSIKGPELLDMYVGQSEKNMREVFATARNSAPCVIFFDEAEAAAGSRGASGDSGGAADRLVSQLLAELDGVALTQIDTPNAAVIVVAATNRPDLVEPALMRPGRIDKLIYVGPYVGVSDKVRVLKASSRSNNLGESVDFDIIAANLPEKCTGADLSSIVNNARHQALVRTVHNAEIGSSDISQLAEKDIVIEQDDLSFALQNFVPSISANEMNHYESLRSKFL